MRDLLDDLLGLLCLVIIAAGLLYLTPIINAVMLWAAQSGPT